MGNDRDAKYYQRMLERQKEKAIPSDTAQPPTIVVIKDDDSFLGIPKQAIKLILTAQFVIAVSFAIIGLFRGYGLIRSLEVIILLFLSMVITVIVQYVYWRVYWWFNGCMWVVIAILMLGVTAIAILNPESFQMPQLPFRF